MFLGKRYATFCHFHLISVFLHLFTSPVCPLTPPLLSPSPILSPFSAELEIKHCHLPTHCTLLCSLGCESAHYSNKYLRGIRGILRVTSKKPAHPQPLSATCFCWSPILFTWTGFNGSFFLLCLSNVKEHLANFQCKHVKDLQRLWLLFLH